MQDGQNTTDQETSAPPASAHGLSDILRDTATALYHWSAADDRIRWSGNAAGLFDAIYHELPRVGADYEALLDEDVKKKRQRAIIAAAKGETDCGLNFEQVLPIRDVGLDGRQKLFRLAECGHLLINEDGTIAGIHGSLHHIRAGEEGLAAASADLDPLTGAMTRSALSAQLNSSIAKARAKSGSCALLVAAIDKLAVVNDSFGFEIADTVIAEISRRMHRVLREGDMIGRIAGNKFAVLIHDCTTEDAATAAQRVREAVSISPVEIESTEVVVTVSVGCVLVPRFAPDAEKAMTRGIEALNDARHSRRSGYAMYEPDTRRDVQRRDNLRLANDLLSALSEDRMGVALQPIVSTTNDEPAFYEALVRVRSRDGEDVTAGAFMGLADKLGLVHLIDTRMLDLVVSMLIADESLKVSLNVAVSTALDPDWFQRITDHVLRNRSIAPRMIVEITETEAIQDIEETAAVVAWIHDLGCKVALDDFGAGYTTYRNLRDLGVDLVKIDGAFMRNLHRSEADQMFVKTLIDLSQNLGIETVAEWVEDERDADLLKQWGAEYIQGHLYGRAVTRYMPCDGPLEKGQIAV
ncbi:EAL domain-containing protein [Tepidamorphus sp. 3E244]|uniref:EAL domain-containing protein n=1 Tax=Tepidamorphus sp. 3E244 TaxID=3385498 RepID=UPI0038FD1DEA